MKIKKFFTKDQNIWFTSDLHFNHTNIINYCKRPFNDVKEMDETLIYYWNKYIKPKDIVFILGDFIFGGSAQWKYYCNRLNGKKYLILGNHDEHNFQNSFKQYFEEVSYMMHIQINDQDIILSHYPLLCYPGSYNKRNPTWNLFGHIHSGENSTSKDLSRLSVLFPYQYDVGVDNNAFSPVNFSQLKNYFQNKEMPHLKVKILNFILKFFKPLNYSIY